uniref:Cyclin-like domain-containing protein n=1 Tax=Kalanchoe fedtschenkoi TaxID=63787 RepID=A0A7N0SYN4_KALFE
MTAEPSSFPLPVLRSSPMPLLSELFCDEQTLQNHLHIVHSPESFHLDATHFILSDLDLAWDQAELDALLSREQHLGCLDVDSEFLGVRKEAAEWIVRVCKRYGFSGVTAVLGVTYFDRFLSGVEVRKGKPWMGQLAAVACLSLAAKMEEIAVPLLVDLQVEGANYVFEAKTVQRMELLVLSALKWKMNHVTPFSFLDHFIRRFGLNKVHLKFLNMCETLFVSVIAAATMLYAIQEFEPVESFGYQEQLVDVLKISKEKLEECYNLISEVSKDKRHEDPAPSSPHGVIGMSFSCENSNDSWVASSIVSSHSEQPSKRRRTQEQQMRLRLPFDWPGFP